MNEDYVFYVIFNPITEEYYEGVDGVDERTYRWRYKYCKKLINAYHWDTRRDANEYIRENLQNEDLTVKKLKVSYSRS
jgi:hypothetical protein